MVSSCLRKIGALMLAHGLAACGGYDAADPSDLKAAPGQIVGVLVDDRGKAHPDATISLIFADGTSLVSSSNMDSDGSFGLWPTAAGTYNVIGAIGDADKVIYPGIVVPEGFQGTNIGTLRAAKVGLVSVDVDVPDGLDPSGVTVHVLGTEVSGTTLAEGLGVLAGIPAGTYTVTFAKDGLAPTSVPNVVLGAGEAKALEPVSMKAP